MSNFVCWTSQLTATNSASAYKWPDSLRTCHWHRTPRSFAQPTHSCSNIRLCAPTTTSVGDRCSCDWGPFRVADPNESKLFRVFHQTCRLFLVTCRQQVWKLWKVCVSKVKQKGGVKKRVLSAIIPGISGNSRIPRNSHFSIRTVS